VWVLTFREGNNLCLQAFFDTAAASGEEQGQPRAAQHGARHAAED
jgi:hypothetical protein